MKTKTKKKIISFPNHLFCREEQDSDDLVDLSKELLRITQKNKEKSNNRKEKMTLKDCIRKAKYSANTKIQKKYNCTPKQYDNIIVDYLLNNADCHLVSIFKEKMLTDYVDEFLRRQYNIDECNERIPKFSVYYKNYLQFFCKPTYNNFQFNDLIQNYGEKKAEIYYKDHYQGGLSNDEEDNGFEESSSSDESSNKEPEFEFNDNNGEIFNKVVKEKLDNVTVMTTINSTGNNTINLNINNEKIEVFSENKAEISNDTTINDLMEDIKKETKRIKNKKKESIKNKFKNSYKKITNYSLKTKDNNNNNKVNKSHKNLSIETKKKTNSKECSKKSIFSKDKNTYRIMNNDKILNQKIKTQIFKYNIESNKINKNNIKKMTHNKFQKILKKKYTKNTYYNNIYNNINLKESHIFTKNLSSNIKSPDSKSNKKNSITGFSGRQIKCRSRNNFGSLYKNITVGTNTTTNKNSNINFQTTHNNKNSLPNLNQNGNSVYNTMNFMKTARHHRTNSQLIKKHNLENVKNKFQFQNMQDKKTSSLKMLVTDAGNPTYMKPTIKIKKNDKLKSKNSNVNIYNINNKKIIINRNENNLNNKITVTTNNDFNNLNNRYCKNPLKKNFVESNDSIIVNNQNYSNFGNQLSSKQLLYNKEDSESFNKDNCHTKSNSNLMKLALSLLIENNSPSKQINQNTKNLINSNGNINLNSNNNLIKNNAGNQKNNKNSCNGLKTATHYNININNQININIDNKRYNKNNNFGGNKLKKKTNKKKTEAIISVGLKKSNNSKKISNINTNSNNKIMNIPSLNNKIKIKTRNYNVSLKNGFTTQNNNSRSDKVIKGYHTKSVSNLTDLINHNKKLISLYKSMSKSKSKDK